MSRNCAPSRRRLLRQTAPVICLAKLHLRAGIIVPTGIATDDTCKAFFADLNQRRAVVSLFDFENPAKASSPPWTAA